MADLGINIDITSVQVGSGYKVTLYIRDNFSGAALVEARNDPSLGDDGWDNRPVSLRLEYKRVGNGLFAKPSL